MSIHAIGQVEFTGEEYPGRFSSSQWAERGFCKNCGSSLFYHLLPRAEMPDGEYILSAGAVNEQDKMNFDHEVYVDHQPGWYQFADAASRKRMTEADLLAMFAPPQ